MLIRLLIVDNFFIRIILNMKWPWSNDKESGSSSSSSISSDFNSNIEGENVQPMKSNYTPGQKILLRDTEPRFQDYNENNNTNTNNNGGGSSGDSSTVSTSTFKQALNTISKDQFTFENLVNIPCFRDAGMLGFSAMFVMGISTAIINRRKPLSTKLYWNRIINWSVGSLLLGSVVGWEQCRLQRRKSFEIAQLAIETVQRKEKPMLKPKDNSKSPQTQELLKEWKEHPNDVTRDDFDDNSKPWYKFW